MPGGEFDGQPSGRHRVGLVVIHGVGETEPGYAVNTLLDTLKREVPGYTIAPYSQFQRFEEPGSPSGVGVFPVVSRSGSHRDGAEIDHIELFGSPSNTSLDSRNFVLCPGNAYDRSPCGTGTSAKLACLAADGKFAEGNVWRQESIVGSVFEGSYRVAQGGGGITPTITGQAFVCGEGTLLMDPADPFCWGIRPVQKVSTST